MRVALTFRLVALLLSGVSWPAAAIEAGPQAAPASAAESKPSPASPPGAEPVRSEATSSTPAVAPAPAPTAAAPAPSPAATVPASEPTGTPAPARAEQSPAAPAPSPAPAAAAPKSASTVKPSAATVAKPRPPAPPPVARVSADPTPTFGPETFVRTMRAAETYLAAAEAGEWPVIPPGPPLKIGDRGPRVAVLRQRLAATEDLPSASAAGNAFDAAVLAAVRRFQARHGLNDSGLVADKTLAALNVSALTRARQLAASAQRLMGSRFPFGERYLAVNIPSATVEAVERGQVVRRYVAVVGKSDRPSPTVETRVTNVNFNPTWTVPVSLIKKDIIPHVRKDPAYLAKMKIRILDGQAREVDPARIDWSTEKAANYTVRQDAGTANSLGQVRIDMPNRHAVYMHDTPSKQLFARDLRFHSSGCVRVADVKSLVQWLLDGTIGPTGPWTLADMDAAIATGQRVDVKLAKPVPVAWVYLTGYATPDGTVHFRDDVYGLDTAKDPEAPSAAVSPPPRPAIDVPTTSSIEPRRERLEPRPTRAATAPLPPSVVMGDAAPSPPKNVGSSSSRF